MSDRLPLTNTPSSRSTQSSSSSPSGSSGPFMYTPYQPPPARQPQESPQQQQYNPPRSLSSTGQSRLSLGSAQWLDLEPVSPGASTLVGSPITPQFDSAQSGRFPWRTPTTPTTPTTSQLPPPQYPAPTLRFSHCDAKGYEHETSAFGGDTLGPAAAARTLAHYDHGDGGGYLSQQQYQKQQNQSWEPHVSVPMDEISLDSFSPSDDCHGAGDQKSKVSRNKPPAYGNKKRAPTPQSESGQSSNMSTITLLAVQQTPTHSSSSSTLFGGFMFSKAKSSSGFHKLNDPTFTTSDIAQQQRQQGSTVGPDRKVYSKQPKAKQFGKKGTGGGGGGGGGNGDRKALFSNERTFMHWIKFGILLGTTALTLCNFGTMDSLAFHIGVTVLVVAMSSLGYAAALFHRRDRSLERRLQSTLARKQAKLGGGARTKFLQHDQGEICYYDRIGPTVLCSVLLFAYSINFYLSIMGGTSMHNTGQSFFHQE
ncbi:hypothetical protein EMPS_06014 [Entomortierella parvispora]|uniref:DUF202 domain-containing protein n=1 Tax=Entomortierella parvispora TaxID=205924 RepID=A0A9P3HBH6_9FUNG|nr:hypothetical protein EMPS_06014 [Entomortierella parvispora]